MQMGNVTNTTSGPEEQLDTVDLDVDLTMDPAAVDEEQGEILVAQTISTIEPTTPFSQDAPPIAQALDDDDYLINVQDAAPIPEEPLKKKTTTGDAKKHHEQEVDPYHVVTATPIPAEFERKQYWKCRYVALLLVIIVILIVVLGSLLVVRSQDDDDKNEQEGYEGLNDYDATTGTVISSTTATSLASTTTQASYDETTGATTSTKASPGAAGHLKEGDSSSNPATTTVNPSLGETTGVAATSTTDSPTATTQTEGTTSNLVTTTTGTSFIEEQCTKEYYLNLSDEDLWSAASHAEGNCIGTYCYIYTSTGPTACKYYCMARPNPSDTYAGAPRTVYDTGTGCIKLNDASFCYFDSPDYNLTDQERQSMCTPNPIANGAAQLRWAIQHDWCMEEGAALNSCPDEDHRCYYEP